MNSLRSWHVQYLHQVVPQALQPAVGVRFELRLVDEVQRQVSAEHEEQV